MPTKNTSIRFPQNQYEQIQKLASLYGETVTNFMRQTILERLEDEMDYRDAIANKKASNGEVVSREEIMKRLDMTNE